MKTKTLLYILMSVLVLSFASCTDDDKIDYLTKEEIPESIQTFASKYLPNNKMLSAYIDKDYGGGFYFVQFEDGVKAQFLPEGTWFILESEKGLPETAINLLSKESRKQFSEQHAAAKITTLNKNTNPELGIWITLDNKKVLNDMFGHEGNVLAEMLSSEAISALPDKLQLFLKDITNMNTRAVVPTPWQHIIKFSGFKGTIYRLRITPDMFVDFYEDGEWFYMKEAEKKNIIKDTLIKAIPKEVIATLNKEEPNAIASIQKITRFDDNKDYGFNKLYGFDFGDNQFILINSENKVVEPPLDKAKEFIKKGFGLEDGLEYKVNSNTTTPYFLRYGFIVTGDMGKISLVTDVNGNMRSISAGPITTETGKTIALPRAIIETLHKDIVNYFDTNYPKGDIVWIFHSYSKTGDNPGEVNLMMPIPNNLKTLIFDTKSGEFIREYNTLQGQE